MVVHSLFVAADYKQFNICILFGIIATLVFNLVILKASLDSIPSLEEKIISSRKDNQ